jgi:protoheme IX farnesyltransferase
MILCMNLDILVLTARRLKDNYWPLIKSRQTFMLTFTGVAGFLCQRPSPMDWPRFLGLIGSLLTTIGGCTVLNMVFDRDIDRKMERTSQRPLVARQVNVRGAACLGGVLITIGLIWALRFSVLYCILILAGASLDVLVYTLWLKRRSAWSILWGGLSGGMPILAGHTLAVGKVYAAGLLLALAIVCWIPSHNLTLGMLYSADYLNAGVPTFLNVYGLAATRTAVTISSLLTVILMAAAFGLLNLPLAMFAILSASGLGLVGLAFYAWAGPSRQAVGALYKYSSFYMLVAMLLLSLTVLK